MSHTAEIVVELFGTARIASGRRTLQVNAPGNAEVGELVSILAATCPSLIGIALREDLSGLMESYTLNLNGTEFVESDKLTLHDGDTLLLFSSMAGG